MKDRSSKASGEIGTVWERPEPVARPAPAPLSRDAIVRAAIAIADTEGLASVSLRKVGAALDAGPMRLYGYMATKEELLDLMVDAVYAEIALAAGKPRSWRGVLRATANAIRQAAHRHPWFADLLGGRPHQGPNALAYLERLLAALDAVPGLSEGGAMLQAAKTINAYVTGAVRSEASERRAERESGMDKAAWQAASWPTLRRLIATGEFPMLAKVVREAKHLSPDAEFEQGLECVLDGIAGRIPAEGRPRAPRDRSRES
jgi:AcrR family transcriptional regulator